MQFSTCNIDDQPLPKLYERIMEKESALTEGHREMHWTPNAVLHVSLLSMRTA